MGADSPLPTGFGGMNEHPCLWEGAWQGRRGVAISSGRPPDIAR